MSDSDSPSDPQPVDPKKLIELRDNCLRTARSITAALTSAGIMERDDLPTLAMEKNALMGDGGVMGCQFIVPESGGRIRYLKNPDGSRRLILELAEDMEIDQR
jgi:hypothetical protein